MITSSNLRQVDPHLGLRETQRLEITDPEQIKKKIDRAKAKFSIFLSRRTSKWAKVGWEINFEYMLMNLGLNNISRDIALREMDNIVLIPGFVKTATGYAISNPELIIEKYGPKDYITNTLKVFTDNPGQEFTVRQIADELGCDPSPVSIVIKKLLDAGKITLIRKIEVAPSGHLSGNRVSVYRLAVEKK